MNHLFSAPLVLASTVFFAACSAPSSSDVETTTSASITETPSYELVLRGVCATPVNANRVELELDPRVNPVERHLITSQAGRALYVEASVGRAPEHAVALRTLVERAWADGADESESLVVPSARPGGTFEMVDPHILEDLYLCRAALVPRTPVRVGTFGDQPTPISELVGRDASAYVTIPNQIDCGLRIAFDRPIAAEAVHELLGAIELSVSSGSGVSAVVSAYDAEKAVLSLTIPHAQGWSAVVRLVGRDRVAPLSSLFLHAGADPTRSTIGTLACRP